MRVFQIQKDEVLIINDDKQYTDTIENFKLDSGLSLDNINEVIYDNYQECCVVNKEFKEYPNVDFEGYIESILRQKLHVNTCHQKNQQKKKKL